MIPKVSTIPIQHLASGDRLSLQLYKFLGAIPGKKAYLQSNLHGAEIVGNAIIHQLISYLMTLDETQLVGEIWLVPVCNPISTNQRSHYFSTGRYNVCDGKDWNRIFWDYEQECQDLESFAKSQIRLAPQVIIRNYRNQILSNFEKQLDKINAPSSVSFNHRYRYHLQSLCLDADYVIDIHSSSNQAIDYLYLSAGREKSARAFLLERGLLLNKYDGDAFDEAFIKPWLALERELARLGKPILFEIEAWTLELGSGMQMNPESVEKGVRGIKNYLAMKELLNLSDFPLAETKSHQMVITSNSYNKRYYAPAGGMIQSRVECGTFIKAGKRLYQLLCFNKEGKISTVMNVCAERDGLVFDVSTNHAVNQGEYVLSTMG